jgi:hypothetical protein
LQEKWWDGFGNATLQEIKIEFPVTCDGGDVGENVYTYRDMVPVKLESHGHAHCSLKVKDSDQLIVIEGHSIHMEMQKTPKYIKHYTP